MQRLKLKNELQVCNKPDKIFMTQEKYLIRFLVCCRHIHNFSRASSATVFDN